MKDEKDWFPGKIVVTLRKEAQPPRSQALPGTALHERLCLSCVRRRQTAQLIPSSERDISCVPAHGAHAREAEPLVQCGPRQSLGPRRLRLLFLIWEKTEEPPSDRFFSSFQQVIAFRFTGG